MIQFRLNCFNKPNKIHIAFSIFIADFWFIGIGAIKLLKKYTSFPGSQKIDYLSLYYRHTRISRKKTKLFEKRGNEECVDEVEEQNRN